MGRLAPLRSRGRFSNRLTSGIGGNRNSGLFEEFPLGHINTMRNFAVSWNDFERFADYDATNDWTAAVVGAGAAQATSIISDTNSISAPYGILRVNAGTTDATGESASRVVTGSNAATLAQLALVSSGDPTFANSSVRAGHRRVAFGARIRLTETGTATQSAFVFGMTRDEETHITTAGALAGIAGCFGFSKAVGSNAVTAWSRNSASAIDTDTTYTMVPGTSTTTGTWVELAMVCELRSTTSFLMDCYVNGNYVLGHASTGSTSTPSADAYSPFFAVVNGTGADCTLDVDYYWTMSERF